MLTKDKLREMRQAIDAALEPIAKANGLERLITGNCSYDGRGGSFTFKLEGLIGGGKSKEAQRYEYMVIPGVSNPLPPLGWEFENSGQRYRITGANSTGSKVTVERISDGKGFLFNTDFIRTHYGRTLPKAANG